MTADLLLMATATLLAIGIVAAAMLRGWQGWLQLKLRELDQRHTDRDLGAPVGMARIELADLKERIRKLEAIAAGVDL